MDGHLPPSLPALWKLKDAAHLPELDDERFSTQAGRLEHNDELQAILTAWTLSQTGDDLRRFAQKGYPVTVAETPEGLLRSEQWATRGFVNQVDHPTGPASVLGPLWQNEGIHIPRLAPCPRERKSSRAEGRSWTAHRPPAA
jgi:formyl-CoA transferase